jgi:subtilisin family serine protease
VKRSSIWARRILAAATATGLTVGALTASAATAASAAPADPSGQPKTAAARDTLGSHDHELLAAAEASGEPRVTLIVAADRGRTQDVSGELTRLGGKITTRVDAVGYLRVSVPTGAVRAAARVAGVTAIDLNESIPLPQPVPDSRPGAAAGPAQTVAGPGPTTPAANPFMPTHETGAVDFKRRHPTWDGRGVTIGIVDTGVDLDNPWLQTTSTGERKIVDWVTATDPVFDGDATWRVMFTDAIGPTFTAAGATWTAPAGTFKFNRFNERATQGSVLGSDVNRDGDTTDLFGVLYDPVTHNIWVDTNQNLDFTDDALMRPYRERFDVGHFGVDNPATEVRDQVPFVVEFREDVDATPLGLPGAFDFVNIGIISNQHGSHVAGITAADNMLGNSRFDGAAPGAKLISSRACLFAAGCTNAALTDGMVDLVVNRHVDVVNMSIGGLPALNDGNNARAQLYNRLIREFGVQLIFSAGNDGPGVNTAGDPAVATDVISVAASISKATYLANYGSVIRVPYQMHAFSARGPREDGGFKPNIAAPGAAISTTPIWQPGSPVAEAGYGLPPGLSMLQGTSMAAPEATGATALLLSAVKATDRAVTPAGLRRAIYSSANWIRGVPAYGQGNGLYDVNGAWSLLARGVQARNYTVDAPVCTPISDFLATPDRGPGVYNRCAADAGGHRAGQAKAYPVTITRTSGPAGRIRHQLRWIGNDGTFSSPRSVVLPLNQPATVVIQARPKIGAHGAILRIDDPATSVVDHETMNVVVAASRPAAPGFSFAAAGEVDRNSHTSYFVTVPEGAAALQVNLSGIATGSQTRWIAINPFGLHVEDNSSPFCYTNFSDPAICHPTSRAYENPLPGVWELEVESRRTSPTLRNPFELTAQVQGVSVTPAVTELPSLTAGVPAPVTWTLTNAFGPVRVQGQGGPLGSSFAGRPTIGHEETDTFEVVVPAGATRLDVAIGNPADLGADLDLTVFRGETQVGQDADGDSEESVSLANPEPGTYRIEVVGFDVPAGSTEYDYRDVFLSPALGAVTVPAAFLTLANGASTTIAGTVVAAVPPAAGRTLSGGLAVVTDEGATVGRGSVVIGAVTGA